MNTSASDSPSARPRVENSPVPVDAPTCDALDAACSLDDVVFAELQALGPDFASSLVEVFLGDASARTGEIRRAHDVANHDALRREAHGLKGSSMTIGAKRLAALCARLEDVARSGRDERDAGRIVSAIEDELGRVRLAFGRLDRNGRGPA